MSSSMGWEAIDQALRGLYGAQEPRHYGTVRRYSEGGPDPLDGISVYHGASPDHWHFVTFGFTELYDKESELPERSGWGFELSLRLRKENETEPPAWVIQCLQQLARCVFNTGAIFHDHDYIEWGGPIAGNEKTDLEALVFSLDPALPTLNTVNGSVQFVRAIGITKEEFQFAAQHGAEKLLALLLADNPSGVIDLRRASVVAGV